MDRARQVLIHLRSTFHPIRPPLTGAIALLRGDARAILVMLVLCTLALTAMREAVNYQVEHSVRQMYSSSQDLQQWDVFCKAMRDFPAASQSAEISEEDRAMYALCLTPLLQRARQVSLYVSIGGTAKSSAALVVTVILYLWTSARMASRSTASPGRTAAAMTQRETINACLAAVAILLAPALLLHIANIAGGLFFGEWTTGPFYSAPQVILRDSLSAVWFFIAAPFVLPAVPLALTTSRTSAVARSAHLGWDRYLQFAALAVATTGPFIGVAALANWYIREPTIFFLFRDLDLGYFSRVVFDILLTALALVAVIAIAAAFVVAIGPRTRDTR